MIDIDTFECDITQLTDAQISDMITLIVEEKHKRIHGMTTTMMAILKGMVNMTTDVSRRDWGRHRRTDSSPDNYEHHQTLQYLRHKGYVSLVSREADLSRWFWRVTLKGARATGLGAAALRRLGTPDGLGVYSSVRLDGE